MSMPEAVRLVEVGPRDGLQNQAQMISTADKIDFINQLSETGLKTIEATAFVSPRWIPQLADHAEVYSGIKKKPGVHYPVLVPNAKGMEAALAAGVKDIAVFMAASETFSKKNTNCSIAESLQRIEEILVVAKASQIAVRGYLSCVAGCPYEGAVPAKTVVSLTEQLFLLGCDEVSLGDTIGVGTPGQIQALLQQVCNQVDCRKVAVHFHDTYGQALANIYVALQLGIEILDSAVAGLGGCPYAKGATGNVATEDVLYMLNGLGIRTGVEIQKVVKVGRMICERLGEPVRSKANQAMRGL